METPVSILVANTLDGHQVLLELSDGSTISVTLAQILALAPTIIEKNEGLTDGPPWKKPTTN